MSWTSWAGGRAPVEPQDVVQVKLRDGSEHIGRAGDFLWLRFNLDLSASVDPSDVMAWRHIDDQQRDQFWIDLLHGEKS